MDIARWLELQGYKFNVLTAASDDVLDEVCTALLARVYFQQI